MTQINPFTGAIIAAGHVAPQQSAAKDRQIRRTQNLGKNAALQGDHLEHEVESTDTLHSINDGGNPGGQKRRGGQAPPKKDEGEDHIDLTA